MNITTITCDEERGSWISKAKAHDLDYDSYLSTVFPFSIVYLMDDSNGYPYVYEFIITPEYSKRLSETLNQKCG